MNLATQFPNELLKPVGLPLLVRLPQEDEETDVAGSFKMPTCATSN
jgi:hypothetical protein